MKQALILGKFMPPHLGHKYLIDFAINYPDVDVVDVIVGTQPSEPIQGSYRALALMDHYRGNQDVTIHHLHKTMPQYPEDAIDFWDQWKATLRPYVGAGMELLVFASEPYGEKLAEILGGKFVPVDVARTVTPISGSSIREHTDENWNLILPEMHKFLAHSVTVFGADSVGKTTLTSQLAEWYHGIAVPEYARGYCELKGTDITDDKLKDIASGQAAQDRAILYSPRRPWIIRDTDLITTIGYTQMMGKDLDPCYMKKLWCDASETLSDFYIVLDTDIPFTPDPMRYGGDKRQSTTEFWTDILHSESIDYAVVRGENRRDRLFDAIKKIDEYFWEEGLT